jgi:hypothetical protein
MAIKRKHINQAIKNIKDRYGLNIKLSRSKLNDYKIEFAGATYRRSSLEDILGLLLRVKIVLNKLKSL